MVSPVWKKTLSFGLVLLVLPLLTYLFKTDTSQQIIHYEPIQGPISNPLMGWAPWATVNESMQPHTLVFADVSWREFEPQRRVYDFDGFERKHQLARWREENKRVVFRFVCDRPGPEEHIDIPDWLYQATNGSGDRYSNEYGKGFSPEYTNPTFIQAHKEVILALGEQYGKDGFFVYVELGSLGHWGEWHISPAPGIRPMPSEKIRDEYIQHYVEAFPGSLLLMRRPFRTAKHLNLGLYNDMTGDYASTIQWLDWIANGGDYNQTGEKNALSAMPYAWRIAPIGGELTSSLSHIAVFDTYLNQTIQLLEQSHTTFIGPHSPYDVGSQSLLQPGIDRVMERIGYRIFIQQVKLPFRLIHKQRMRLAVSITFANDGIAPLYTKWPGEFYILDESGNIRSTYRPDMDVRKILPGKAYHINLDMPIDGLKKGKYALAFAIIDPLSNNPAVKLVMANPRSDLIQELGTFEIASIWKFLPGIAQ